MRVHPGHKGIDPPHLRLRRGSLRGIGARWLPEFCRSLPIGIRGRTLDKLSLSATALRAGRNAGRHVGTALRADDIDLRNQFPTFVAFDAGKTCHGKTPIPNRGDTAAARTVHSFIRGAQINRKECEGPALVRRLHQALAKGIAAQPVESGRTAIERKRLVSCSQPTSPERLPHAASRRR